MKKSSGLNAVSFAAMLLLGCHISVLQSLLERISTSLQFSITAAGTLITFNYLGTLLGPIITGEMGDRIGRKPVILGGLGLYVASMALASFSSSFTMMAIAILLIGFAFSTVEATVTSLLTEENANSNQIINLSQSFLSVGAMAGPLIALGMLRLSTGWQGMLLLMAGLFAVMLSLYAFTPVTRRVSVERQAIPGAQVVKLLRQGYFLLLCLLMFIYVGVESATAYWMDTSFIQRLSQPDMGKVALALFWGGTIVGRVIGSRLPRMVLPFLTGGLVLSTLALSATPLVISVWGNVTLFALTGLGFSTVWPALMSIAMDAFPQARGSMVGMLMASCGLGGMVLPLVMGVISDHMGFGVSLWVLPISTLTLILLCIPVIRRVKQKAGTAQ